MAVLELTKKRMIIQIVDKDKKLSRQFYVEKSVLRQIWELYIYPLLLVAIGITIGVIIE